MTALAGPAARVTRAGIGTLDVEIVVPVHNERDDLAPSVRRLHGYLRRDFPFSAVITIADNASTDGTWEQAQRLASELDQVRAVHLDAKGRGRALSAAWLASTARVVAYMDVDLSTDLAALLPLVAPLLSGHSDVAIGSRLARTAQVARGPKREFISRGYNLLLRAVLLTRFSDAQCGFKALRAECARQLLPHVHDTGWFFDTELLVLAERSGLRIAEVPVDWTDDPDSRVDIASAAWADLRGIARLSGALLRGRLPLNQLHDALVRDRPDPRAGAGRVGLGKQLARFVAVGAVSTAAYLVLFVLLRTPLGAQAANLVALLLTAVGNTAANRRYTFGIRGGPAARHHTQGLIVFGIGLALTSGCLAVLSALTDHPGRVVELAVLVGANLAATLLRFVLMRGWIFRPHRAEPPPSPIESKVSPR